MNSQNILIVEDNHAFGEMLKSSFLSFGHRVKLLFDGKEAISFLNKTLPDVIVLDFYLPGHNAVEFINETRSYSDTKKLPIYLYTTYPDKIAGLPENVFMFDKSQITPKQLAEKITNANI